MPGAVAGSMDNLDAQIPEIEGLSVVELDVNVSWGKMEEFGKRFFVSDSFLGSFLHAVIIENRFVIHHRRGIEAMDVKLGVWV